MLKVEGYTQKDATEVVGFIRKIQLTGSIDMGILSCSVLIKDDDRVVGMVSYESHGDMGIVRYFLYDARIAGADIVVGMFFELYKKAYARGIKQLIAKIPREEVGLLFEMLGFVGMSCEVPEVVLKELKPDVKLMAINLEKRSLL